MKRIMIVCSVILLLVARSQAVFAEDSAAAPEAKGPPMFPAGLVGVLGGLNDSPMIVGAVTPIDHMFLGVGVSFNYNAAGQPNPAGGRLNDKVSSNLLLAAQYMVVDHHPFAMGPEIFAVGSLAPSKAFSFLQLQPGWAFWYCPFKAPLAIGSAIDVQIQVPTQHGQKSVVNLLLPALRLGYIFNGI